mmetsp:Transcript_98959/g.262854  ORF Transcript_98959/g.262854 Transcript_98959/m.262854 type:complete len:241 (+) Transcript_98959:1926-2648(+)
MAWFGRSTLSGKSWPVFGDVPCSSSHLAMAALSYVWPSDVITGCSISSRVMQQRNSSGTSISDGLRAAFWSAVLVGTSICTFSGLTLMVPLPSSKANSHLPDAPSHAASVPALPLSSGRLDKPRSAAREPTGRGAGPALELLLSPPAAGWQRPAGVASCAVVGVPATRAASAAAARAPASGAGAGFGCVAPTSAGGPPGAASHRRRPRRSLAAWPARSPAAATNSANSASERSRRRPSSV